MTINNKLLFTPGPLNTSAAVKEAMNKDLGSRDSEFIKTVKDIRDKLLYIADLTEESAYETIIMQGSGTFGIESVISSVIPFKGTLLNIINGAYGRRISQIAKIHDINLKELVYNENEIPSVDQIEELLENDLSITHISIVHCETTTGIFNPVEAIGKLAQKFNKIFIVDAMSSFGAVPVSMANIDFLISSSNKCIEGVPGFSFIIAKKNELLKTKENARTLSLNLYAQWEGLEKNGQFRFTPPIQTILAFKKALDELIEQGGILARAEKYKKNNTILLKGMLKLGFKPYLKENLRGYIINTFHYPDNHKFDFNTFYNSLNEMGYVIYPGKLTKVDCFRIGNIGKINEKDISNLLSAIEQIVS